MSHAEGSSAVTPTAGLHVVYITNGMSSSVHSAFELSRRLVEAGHRVTFLSQADIGGQVAAQGHAFEQFEHDRVFQQHVEADPRPPLRHPLAMGRWLRRRRQLRHASIQNDEIRRTVERMAPDLLLIDVEMHFAILSTAKLAIPTLLVMVFFAILRGQGLPPLHTSLPPGDTSRKRLMIELAWRRQRFATWRQTWRQRLTNLWRGEWARPVACETFDLDALRAIAHAHGFTFRRHTSRAHWLRPYVYTHLPIVSYNVRQLDLPHALHPNTWYVGPMIDRDRREARLDPASAARWQTLLDARARRSDDQQRPLVYCSLGTVWSADEAFLRRVIAVFTRRADWDLVLGLGGMLDPSALAPIPDNAYVLAWAPQLAVLAEADCAITHGGATSLNECIEFQVPMVVYSTHFVDQDGCTARVAYHGLGIVADKDNDSIDQLERNLERALVDPEIRHNLDAMKGHFDAYRRDDRAFELISETIHRTR